MRVCVFCCIWGALLLLCHTNVTSPAQAEPTSLNVRTMDLQEKTDAFSIEAKYPAIGVEVIDADLALWAKSLVEQFKQVVLAEDPEVRRTPYFMGIEYTMSTPSPKAVSIIFEVSTYTGGAHGNLAIVSRNYELPSGELLSPSHILDDVEMAYTLMSTYCHDQLAAQLGDRRVDDMLKSGTTPDADNFSTLSLNAQGIRVHFPPYQVAPWAEGPLYVDVPLAALEDARPLLYLWGQAVPMRSSRMLTPSVSPKPVMKVLPVTTRTQPEHNAEDTRDSVN